MWATSPEPYLASATAVKPSNPPTTDELRAAFKRAVWLRFGGWSFERAMADPLIAWSLGHAALSRRQTDNTPAQPRLI